MRSGGTTVGGSHVHCCPVDELGIRLYPCGIAIGYAVDIHHGLLAPASNTEPEVPRPKQQRVRAANQPTSTGLELALLEEA